MFCQSPAIEIRIYSIISFVRLSRWVAGFVFYCVKNRNPPPTLQPGIFSSSANQNIFNHFVCAFVKVGCGFRFLLRKKSKSSTHPTARDLQPGIFSSSANQNIFNHFVCAFVKVGCGFRFLLRKKSKSSTHPTARDFLMCVCHRRADVMAAPFPNLRPDPRTGHPLFPAGVSFEPMRCLIHS